MKKVKLNWNNSKLKTENLSWGRGLFASEPIAKGETLVVYGGHVINTDDFCSLPKGLRAYYYQIRDDLFFGPASLDEISAEDLINHSCNPNAGFRSEMVLVAMRDISTGEQITIDYALCMTADNRTADILNMDCLCGEANCRKFITGDDWRLPKLQQRYRGYFQPYIEEKIALLEIL